MKFPPPQRRTGRGNGQERLLWFGIHQRSEIIHQRSELVQHTSYIRDQRSYIRHPFSPVLPFQLVAIFNSAQTKFQGDTRCLLYLEFLVAKKRELFCIKIWSDRRIFYKVRGTVRYGVKLYKFLGCRVAWRLRMQQGRCEKQFNSYCKNCFVFQTHICG